MDKKNRTGLQSKISQIFSGVPIPKKRKPLPEDTEHKDKDELSSVLQKSENEIVIEDAVIEKYTAEPQKISEEKRENIIEDSLAQAGSIEHTNKDFSDEEFSVVQDPDSINLAQADKNDVKAAEEISIIEEFETSDGMVKQKPSSEQIQNPQSPPSTGAPAKQTNVQKTVHTELKIEKTVVDGNISAPSVKGQIAGKPELALTHKPEISDTKEPVGVQKSNMGKISGLEAEKKTQLRPSRKISAKPAIKRQKLKKGTNRNRQKIMIGLIIVLLIILAAALYKNFNIFTSNPNNTQPSGQPLPGAAIIKSAGNVTITWPEPPLYPDDIPDPMGQKIIQQTTRSAKSLIIKGIAYNEKGGYVVTIDTENYKIDDKIRDYDATIINITNTTVEFRNSDDATWTRTIGDYIEP